MQVDFANNLFSFLFFVRKAIQQLQNYIGIACIIACEFRCVVRVCMYACDNYFNCCTLEQMK